MEKVICPVCMKVSYTAAPDKVRCPYCEKKRRVRVVEKALDIFSCDCDKCKFGKALYVPDCIEARKAAIYKFLEADSAFWQGGEK